MKRILVFSLGPIFKDHVHGGSQKVLREIAMHLGKRGNNVDIYCVRRDDNNKIFELSDNVRVYPILRFKQTFPSSYKTSPYYLCNIIDILKEKIACHDVFYVHDAGLNFTFLCDQNIPTIISLRDFLYPETLVGAFNFRRDKIVVNSKYTLDSVRHTVGRYLQGLEDRIELIDNGIDLTLFTKTTSKKIFELIHGEIHESDLVILHPHRPDPAKGIYQSLEIVRRLKFNRNLRNIKLLVPRYIDEEVTNDFQFHYSKIIAVSKEKGIEENVLFHRWVPYELMPEYYSLGNLTLSIGNFIEAFGSNIGLESLACETPVVMSLVGAQRTTLPEWLAYKVPYDNLEQTEKIAFDILQNEREFDAMRVRRFIADNFSHKKMLRRYEEVICNTTITKPLEIRFEKKDLENANLVISPWCHLSPLGVYDDYGYEYYRISDILREGLSRGRKVTLKNIKDEFIRGEVLDLVYKGALVTER